MGYQLPCIFALLTFTLVACHAALPPRIYAYWDSFLPNKPVPKSLSQILQPELVDARTVRFSNKNYKNAATEAQLDDDPHVTIFLLEKDMHPGTTLNLDFTRSNTAPFLPRKIIESIPFSSSKLPQILEQFSLKPGSAEADAVKETIEACEHPAMIRGEEKYCATSFESMIDFSTSKLGRGVQAVSISTEVEQGTPVQNYTILSGVKKMKGDKQVACHKLDYAYAVFYCHAIKATRVYTVPLRGADGVNTNAIVFCHTDTSEWDPKHLAFQVLKVKPGTIPICHFFSGDSLVWVPSQKSTSAS